MDKHLEILLNFISISFYYKILMSSIRSNFIIWPFINT